MIGEQRQRNGGTMGRENPRLPALADSALELVAGGAHYTVGTDWAPWDWGFATEDCQNAVLDAVHWSESRGVSQRDMLSAVDDAWNGPSCRNYGWF
jgi:hypothetical protein